MDNLVLVIQIVLKFMQTRLYFSPFSFTILDFLLFVGIASIVAFFIRKVFVD